MIDHPIGGNPTQERVFTLDVAFWVNGVDNEREGIHKSPGLVVSFARPGI